MGTSSGAGSKNGDRDDSTLKTRDKNADKVEKVTSVLSSSS
jgi:hypothetical protein